MKNWTNSDVMLLVVAVLVVFGAGYFAADDSAKISRLQTEVTRLRSELDRSRRPNFYASKLRTGSAFNSPVLRSTPIAPNPEAQQPPSLAEKQAQLEQRGLDQWVARTAAERSEEYTRVFSELGVGLENTERFKSNLVELHKKAIAAGKPLEELMAARNAYDKDMRSVLSPENYLRYRTYEESKPANREYSLLGEYSLNEKKVAID